MKVTKVPDDIEDTLDGRSNAVDQDKASTEAASSEVASDIDVADTGLGPEELEGPIEDDHVYRISDYRASNGHRFREDPSSQSCRRRV